MNDELSWTLETVVKCDHCDKPMIPSVDTWDEEGCGWSCVTADCGDYNDNLYADDWVALGCPAWVAERVEALTEALKGLGGQE